MKNNVRGYSLFEFLVCVCISTIILSSGFIASKKVIFTHQKSYLRKQIYLNTIKLISASTYMHGDSSISFLPHKANTQLVFHLSTDSFRRVELKKTIVQKLTFHTSSLFKDHIHIDPEGYVSPSRITILFQDDSAYVLKISRFGVVTESWI